MVNGSGTSPTLMNGRLILNCDQEDEKSFLIALNPRNGETLWQTPRPGFASSYSTPVLWTRGGTEEILVAGSLRLTAYGLRDGRERWSVGGLEAVSVCPTPVIGAGQAYVMSRSLSGMKMPTFAELLAENDKDQNKQISPAEAPVQLRGGAFSAVDRDKDGFISENEWTVTLALLAKGDQGLVAVRSPGASDTGDLTPSHLAWKNKKGVASVSSPLFYRGRVYVVQDGGRVTCIEAKEGRKLFEQERLGAVGEYYASPIAADGKVFFCSTRGTISVVAAGDTFKVLARNEIGERLMATPAIMDNKLYVRSANHLFAFGSDRR